MLTDPPLDQVVDYDLGVDGENFKVTALQMGNRIAAFLSMTSTVSIGAESERQSRIINSFRTHKCSFVRVKDRHHIELRIWEAGRRDHRIRTCSCAAAVAAMVGKETERAIEVEMQVAVRKSTGVTTARL